MTSLLKSHPFYLCEEAYTSKKNDERVGGDRKNCSRYGFEPQWTLLCHVGVGEFTHIKTQGVQHRNPLFS